MVRYKYADVNDNLQSVCHINRKLLEVVPFVENRIFVKMHFLHCLLLVVLSVTFCWTTNPPNAGIQKNPRIQEFMQVASIKLTFSLSVNVTEFELMEYKDKSVSIRIANDHMKGYSPFCSLTGASYTPNVTEALNTTASLGDVLYFKLDEVDSRHQHMNIFEYGKNGVPTQARVVQSIATRQWYMELPVKAGYNGPFYRYTYGNDEITPEAKRYTVLYLAKSE